MKPQFSMNADDVQKDIDEVTLMLPEISSQISAESAEKMYSVLQDLIEFRNYLKGV